MSCIYLWFFGSVALPDSSRCQYFDPVQDMALCHMIAISLILFTLGQGGENGFQSESDHTEAKENKVLYNFSSPSISKEILICTNSCVLSSLFSID